MIDKCYVKLLCGVVCCLTLSLLRATNLAVLEATAFKIGHVFKSRNLVIMVY